MWSIRQWEQSIILVLESLLYFLRRKISKESNGVRIKTQMVRTVLFHRRCKDHNSEANAVVSSGIDPEL